MNLHWIFFIDWRMLHVNEKYFTSHFYYEKTIFDNFIKKETLTHVFSSEFFKCFRERYLQNTL